MEETRHQLSFPEVFGVMARWSDSARICIEGAAICDSVASEDGQLEASRATFKAHKPIRTEGRSHGRSLESPFTSPKLLTPVLVALGLCSSWAGMV